MMKAGNIFWVSLCYMGAHSGGLYITDEGLFYRTNKLLLPPDIKNINIKYGDIEKVVSCRSLAVFPAARLILKNGVKYKFIVFRRNKFVRIINDKINNFLKL